VGPIGVQRHGHAVLLDDRIHDLADAFSALPQVGVQQTLRLVIDGSGQEPLLGPKSEPAMAATVQTEQLAEARAPLTPAAGPDTEALIVIAVECDEGYDGQFGRRRRVPSPKRRHKSRTHYYKGHARALDPSRRAGYPHPLRPLPGGLACEVHPVPA